MNSACNAIPTGLCIKRAQVTLHWSFIVLFAFRMVLVFLAFDVGKYFLGIFLYEFLLYGPILFVIILLHECFQVTTAAHLSSIERIVLCPLGGLTVYGGLDMNSDLKVSLAGVMSHFILLCIFATLYAILKNDEMNWNSAISLRDMGSIGSAITLAFKTSFFWNIYLFLLHLLIPIYPMNGLRIWVRFLLGRGFSLETAAIISSSSGLVASSALVLWGILKFFSGEIGGGINVIFLAGLGTLSSKILYERTKAGRVREHVVFVTPWYEEYGTSGNRTHSRFLRNSASSTSLEVGEME